MYPHTHQPRLSITKLVMVETGSYNDMYARPFRTQVTNQTINQFQEVTQGGSVITAAALSGIAGNIVKPSAEPSGQIMIPNGWRERRFRFMLEVLINTGAGADIKEVLTGYTDFLDPSFSGHLDPRMRMYFNNSLMIRTLNYGTPHGVVSQASVSEVAHILIPPSTAGFHDVRNPYDITTMRPEDVMGAISTRFLSDITGDYRCKFVDGAKKSNRSNGLAPEYVSRMMQAVTLAHKDERNLVGDHANMYANARDMIRDPMISKDQFLGMLAMETPDDDNYKVTGSVAFGWLCRKFPGLEQQVMAIRQGQTQQTFNTGTGAGEHWHVTTTEAVMATSLSQSVPAVMLDHMITKLIFVASNETMDGSFNIQIRNAASFTDGIDMSPYIELFMQRLRVEILSDLTNNNLFALRLAMSVDILGETRITIGLAGQPEVEFVTPSFCDGLFVPVITNQHDNLNAIAEDIDTLYNGARTRQHPIHPTAPSGGMYEQPTSFGAMSHAPSNSAV